MLDEDKIELEDQEWPEDTIKNPKLIKSLSYTKMKNEVNHREPRIVTDAGTIEPFPVCSTSIGWHSSSPEWRKVDDAIELLGPGTILYLRMLKYFACWFLLFFLISLPSVILYW